MEIRERFRISMNLNESRCISTNLRRLQASSSSAHRQVAAYLRRSAVNWRSSKHILLARAQDIGQLALAAAVGDVTHVDDGQALVGSALQQ